MRIATLVTFIFISAGFWSLPAPAQDGPFVPCSDCVSGLGKVFPTSGPWVNTERDGSGFVLEFQNGVLGGFHFGYDAEGNPEWLLFSGVLTSGEDIPWVVEGSALRFSGGSCIGCPYAPPMGMSPARNLRLEFLQRNYGSFQFDGDDKQFMVPLLFGSAGLAHFQETTPYLFPELTRDPGLDGWAIVFVERVPVIPEFCPHNACAPKNSMVVHFHPGEVVQGNSEMEDKVIYRSAEDSLIEENSDPLLTIECGRFENNDLLCEVTVTDGVHDEIYRMPIANLGSIRFVANGPNGTIEGFRLGYD
jgi:hypothetical protein